jgi:hypothetical protein
LILYGSGLIVSPSSKSDECRIERKEKETFDRFLQTVPAPSFWERTRRGRIKMYGWLIIGGLCGAGFVVVELIGFLAISPERTRIAFMV